MRLPPTLGRLGAVAAGVGLLAATPGPLHAARELTPAPCPLFYRLDFANSYCSIPTLDRLTQVGFIVTDIWNTVTLPSPYGVYRPQPNPPISIDRRYVWRNASIMCKCDVDIVVLPSGDVIRVLYDVVEYDRAGHAEEIIGYGDDGSHDGDHSGDQEIAPGGDTGSDDKWYLCNYIDFGTYRVLTDCVEV